jgi:hypothetical protein
MVTRQREQYWLQLYIEKLISPSMKATFDCMVYGNIEDAASLLPLFMSNRKMSSSNVSSGVDIDKEMESPDIAAYVAGGDDLKCFYEVLVLQLGSFYRYFLFFSFWLFVMIVKKY